MTTLTTPAPSIETRTRSVDGAAADHSDPAAALEAIPPCDSGPGFGSAPSFLDRRRTACAGQARVVHRLPGCRRAAGWSCRRCSVSCFLLGPVAKNWAALVSVYPADSSLLQGNCRPVDPRGSRPANFSPSDNGRQTHIPAPPEPAVIRLRDTPRGRSGTARKAPSTLGGPCRRAGVGTIVRRPTQSERRQFKAWQPGETGTSSRNPVPCLPVGSVAARQVRRDCRPVEQRCPRPAPLSTTHARRLARTRSRASRPACVVVERSTQARSINSARVARLGPLSFPTGPTTAFDGCSGRSDWALRPRG